MQGFTAVPEIDAAIRIGAAAKADDYGLPIVGVGQTINEVTEFDQPEIGRDADVFKTLLDDEPNLLPHAVLGVGHQ